MELVLWVLFLVSVWKLSRGLIQTPRVKLNGTLLLPVGFDLWGRAEGLQEGWREVHLAEK